MEQYFPGAVGAARVEGQVVVEVDPALEIAEDVVDLLDRVLAVDPLPPAVGRLAPRVEDDGQLPPFDGLELQRVAELPHERSVELRKQVLELGEDRREVCLGIPLADEDERLELLGRVDLEPRLLL